MSYQPRQRFQPPELYSIHRGVVTRIEPYGCFVKLHTASPISGLVHISQLHANRITDVNDVVSMDMEVWVKVIDVQVENIEDADSGRTRQRHKIKLSMKYVHQDTGEDLDPRNEQLEGDLQRSRGGGGGGGSRGNAAIDGTSGADSQLGRALASNIGMSSAIDPGSLILKGKGGAVATTSFNGYALVGEDEGEMPAEEKKMEAKSEQPEVVRPMGRGRGTTLPAWMTRSDPDDRLGSMNGAKDSGGSMDKKDNDKQGDGHKRNKHDKRHKKERHRNHSRHSSSRKHGKKHKKRKDRGRSRSHSYSSYSTSSSVASGSYSRSRSRSSERRSRSHRKKKSHNKHRSRRREYSRSRSRSGSPPPEKSDFANVEEARAIMERLERRRREG